MTRVLGVLTVPALLLLSLVRGQDTPANRTAEWKAPASAAELHNPYAGAENHRLAGKKLFQRYCSSCHGKEGGGGGKIPAVTSDKVEEADEGRLFWYIKYGNSRAGMPGWSRLPDQQIWQLVTFLQSPPEK